MGLTQTQHYVNGFFKKNQLSFYSRELLKHATPFCTDVTSKVWSSTEIKIYILICKKQLSTMDSILFTLITCSNPSQKTLEQCQKSRSKLSTTKSRKNPRCIGSLILGLNTFSTLVWHFTYWRFPQNINLYLL